MNNEKGRIIGVLVLLVVLSALIFRCTRVIQKSSNTFVVENGSLSYEENVQGYIIRDEKVLKGENYKNGMFQIKSEGEKVSNGESVFRYYSNGEEEINKQIADLDEKINEALEKSGTILGKGNIDIISLEGRIQNNLDELYGINDLLKQKEYLKKIETDITKKATIAGELSPAGSYIKDLINQRNNLKSQLDKNSEVIKSNMAGVMSYRVDGCEAVLGSDNLSYLNTELLNSLDVELGNTIPQNSESGKIYNNFFCYIACPVSSEKSMEVKVGDEVTLRISNSEEVTSKVEYIVDEKEKRIIVFKIKNNVEELIEYRKISLDIIWWNFSGLKISNFAIKQENDLSYVYRNKAGYTDKILVKVLRQNDTFSIVTNYKKEELQELGFSENEIEKLMKNEIKLFDEILISK